MKHVSALLAFLVLALFARAAEVAKISPADAAKAVADGKAVLIDVREPSEWKESGVAASAELLPMSDFNGAKTLWKPFLEKNADKQLILYCRSGARAGKVGSQLAAQGHPVANAGGFKDWASAGLPTRKVEAGK